LIKLFVSDLDGTLLKKDITITESDKKALEALKLGGAQIAIATGRMDIEIKKIQKMIEESFHRISQNGAFAYTKDDLLLHKNTFNATTAKNLFSLIRKTSFIHLVTDEHCNYTEVWHPFFDKVKTKALAPLKENQNLFNDIGNSINPSKFIILGEYDKINAFQQTLKEEFPHEIETYISDKQCLDIMPKNISKGSAVKALMSQFDLKENEVACIGDSFNDVPMLEMTPYSFAMENALPGVKEKANYIVKSVSEAIEIILKINSQEKAYMKQ